MIRPWMIAAVAAVAAAAPAAAQDPPEAGKARLFVPVDPKNTLSAGDKKLSPALQLCEASGGTLVGIATGPKKRPVAIIDVARGDKSKATDEVKKTKIAEDVADVMPAGAGPPSPVKVLIVGYKKGERPTDDQLKAAGLVPLKGKESPSGTYLVAEAKGGVTAETVKKLRGIAEVTAAEEEQPLSIPPPVKRPPAKVAPKDVIGPASVVDGIKDPFFGKLWGMTDAGVVDLWKAGHRTTDAVVAVIDTGVDVTHEDLQGNIWVNQKEKAGAPGVDDDGNGLVDDVHGYDFLAGTGAVTDANGHGTHCAGTIGARANAIGVVGVCPEVKIMALRFLGPGGGKNYDAMLCIDYAVANGARVINASWGGYPAAPSTQMEAAIRRAADKGVLFVAAAGNDGNDNDGEFKHYPSSFTTDNLIAVMAIDDAHGSGPFPESDYWSSNFGKKSVHLAAPGEGIWSTVPGNLYARYSGTSMAAPHVAGAAALLLNHRTFAGPDATDADRRARMTAVRDALLANAQRKTKADGELCLKGKCVREGALSLKFLAANPAQQNSK